MRKRLRRKKQSCALCKPHKMGWGNRWKPKEEARLREFERERRTCVAGTRWARP
jgi:hypothetical protein